MSIRIGNRVYLDGVGSFLFGLLDGPQPMNPAMTVPWMPVRPVLADILSRPPGGIVRVAEDTTWIGG